MEVEVEEGFAWIKPLRGGWTIGQWDGSMWLTTYKGYWRPSEVVVGPAVRAERRTLAGSSETDS